MALAVEPRNYSILIADDDAGSRDSLREIVEPEGFHTELAADGEEALDIVHHKEIHLLVCDMYMPRLTGLETMELARQVKAVLPCILVSADVDDQLIRQALHAKAYSVIAKPVSKNVLIYTVVRALVKTYQANP